MITPQVAISEQRKKAMQRDIDLFEQNMRRNKYFDSGLSLDEERNALVYAILQHIQQQRALVYHSIYSMVTHLQFHGTMTLQIFDEQVNLDEYEKLKKEKDSERRNLKMSKEFDHFAWIRMKKLKVSHYVKQGFNKFKEMVSRLIKSGVMKRLFD